MIAYTIAEDEDEALDPDLGVVWSDLDSAKIELKRLESIEAAEGEKIFKIEVTEVE